MSEPIVKINIQTNIEKQQVDKKVDYVQVDNSIFQEINDETHVQVNTIYFIIPFKLNSIAVKNILLSLFLPSKKKSNRYPM